MRHFVNERPHRLDDLFYNLPHIHEFASQLDLASVDTTDVHQVIDQTGHVYHLTLDDRLRPLAFRRHWTTLQVQELHCVANRREWITQFVCKDREELVLTAVCISQHLKGGLFRAPPF